MRIGYVIPHYRPSMGGVETHVEGLATHAVRRGHQVEVLTQGPKSLGPATEVIDGVTIRRFRVPVPSTHLAAAPGLWAFLRRSGSSFDVLHAHNYHALPALAAAAAGCRPLVFSPEYHGTSESRFRSVLHRPYKLGGAFLLRRSDRVICLSEQEAAMLLRDFPWAAERVSVIPPAVDVQPLTEAEPFPEERVVVFSAGRLERYKNVDLVVEAMAQLDSRFVLRITGDGPARPFLERRIKELRLGDRAMLLGRVADNELNRWFRTASVYVSMSDFESFGITVLEALAAGSRVVASDIPAHREIAKTTGGAVFIPPSRSSTALARAVEQAAAAEPAPAEIQSWEELADRTLSVYSSVAPDAAQGVGARA
jgi:glycosyltransferase involved in cell wall biosynthesis